MPRVGYTLSRIPYGAADTTNGEGDAVRNFFASNLTTWTVGPVQNFDAANSERSYFVCSSGTHEILVFCPNGYQSSFSTIVHSSRRSTIANGPAYNASSLAMMYAEGGGFNAAFSAGSDPKDAVFFPSGSTFYKILNNYTSATSTSVDLYLIENTDHPELLVYTSSSTHYPSMWGFSQQMFDLTKTSLGSSPAFTWQNHGVLSFDGSTPAGVALSSPQRSQLTFFAPELSEPRVRTGTGEIDYLSYYSDLEGDLFPIDNTYLAPTLATSVGETSLVYDRAFIRQCVNVPLDWGRRFQGDLSTEVFAYLSESLLLPWAVTGLGNPNLP